MLTRIYDQIRILSIDVALGACAMSYFLAYSISVKLPFSCLFVLAGSVWLIYTLDHLMDARKIKHRANTLRHRFHQDNFKSILVAWGLAFLIVAVVTILYVPSQTIKYGSIVLMLSVFYLLLVELFGSKKSFFIQKEIGVAAIYTAGIFVAPFSLSSHTLSADVFILLTQIFLLALTNLYVFNFYEYEIDKKDGHTSFLQLIGKNNFKKLINFLFIFYAFSSLLFCIVFHMNRFFIQTEFIFLFMMFIFSLLFYKRNFFYDNYLYRVIGDAVFFFPLLITVI
jgi:hypothetical protein